MIVYVRFRLQRIYRRFRRRLRQTRQRLQYFLHFGLFSKWRQFVMVRRFVLVWWMIMLVAAGGLLWQIRGLRDADIVLQKLPGGSYTEGVVGTVKNINPIFPEGSASADAVRLIFSGLTRFDTNGQLQPDLATDWAVSPDGKTYTFHLRPGVRWQDGTPFSAQDVVFTIKTIQNPDARSPLEPSWRDVGVTAPDADTVIFTLPKPDAPFINATTVGILPQHLLADIPAADLSVAGFNQHPIGTGPFTLTSFDTTGGQINLAANRHYYLGSPLLNTLSLRLYSTAAAALAAYTHRQVQGVSRLEPDQVATARSLGTMKIYSASTPDEVAVFLQTTHPVLKDKLVRQALAEATNRVAIVNQQLHDQATPLASPLLPSAAIRVSGAPHQADYNPDLGAVTLQQDGWQLGRDGVRVKDGVRLELQLVTQTDSLYGAIAKQLAAQWRKIGVQLDIKQVDAQTLQQSYIRPRYYDALLYGINTGADPDVYAYWDSSQIKDPGLNLSDYSSPAADSALEAARTLQSPALRAEKYRNFVQAWTTDNPAIMLYTPLYEYGVDSSVYGIHIHHLINPADRFNNVQNWAVRVRGIIPGP